MRLLRHLLHLLPRASKFLGALASWLCAGLLKLKSPLWRAFFMAKSQGNWGNWGQILINSHSKPPAMVTHFSGLSLKKWSLRSAVLSCFPWSANGQYANIRLTF
jgi:hypothetical protein